MSGYKPYPKYKDSGIEWLGDLPLDWEIKPVKSIATCNDDVISEDTSPDTEIEYVEISDVNESAGITGSLSLNFSEAPSRARRLVKHGDTIISTVRTYLRAIAPVINPPINLVVSTGFAVLRPKKVDGRYLGFTIRSNGFIGEVISNSVGVSYPAINSSVLTGIRIPVPSLSEQKSIAAFLDRETGKLDLLIREQKALITLLQEKRQALISKAVTKGLNPKAKMKDSGVEWLGEVPENWDLKRLRRLCDITTGGKDTENRVDDGEYPFFVRSQVIERIDSYSFDGEGILTAGDGVGVAKVFHHYTGKFDFHQRVYLLYNFKKEISGAFLFEYIREHFHKEVLKLSAKSTVDSLRMPMFQDFPVLVPPNPEQASILKFLNVEVGKIDMVIKESEETIDLMYEHRSSLISEAVTGKIDVR